MWSGIIAKIRISIPEKYPYSPPSLTYLNPAEMLHPNIAEDTGIFCIPIINPSEWSPTNNLTDICTALYEIFESPDWGNNEIRIYFILSLL